MHAGETIVQDSATATQLHFDTSVHQAKRVQVPTSLYKSATSIPVISETANATITHLHFGVPVHQAQRVGTYVLLLSNDTNPSIKVQHPFPGFHRYQTHLHLDVPVH